MRVITDSVAEALLNEHPLVKVCRRHGNDSGRKAARCWERNPADMRIIIFLNFPLAARLTEVNQRIQGEVSDSPCIFR